MDKFNEKSESGCCQRFDPAPWDEKEAVFDNRLFIKNKVLAIFNIPLNLGQIIVKNIEKIEKSKALLDKPIMLYDCKSLFSADVYTGVARDVEGAEMVKISGKFLTKVFEGEYKDMGGWIKQMKEYVASKGKELKKMYFFYTTCPSCAKFYGKNYTVILAQI